MTTILIFLTVCAAGCIAISFLDKEEVEGDFAAYHKIMKKQKSKEKELNIQTNLQDEEPDISAEKEEKNTTTDLPIKDNPADSLQDKKFNAPTGTEVIYSTDSPSVEENAASAAKKKKPYSRPEVKVMKIPDLYPVEKADVSVDITNKKSADDFYDFYDADDDW